MLNATWAARYERAKQRPWFQAGVTAFKTVDSAAALGILAGWMAAVGIPRRLRKKPRPRGPLRACFVSAEGRVVAPTRIRCYQFADEARKHGVEVDVLAFWSDVLGFSGLPPRPLFAVEQVVTALRAFRRLEAGGYDVAFFQRPTYDLVTAALLRWLGDVEVVFDIDDWIFEYPVFTPLRSRHTLPHLRRIGRTCVVSSTPLAEAVGPHFDEVVLLPTYVDARAFAPRPRAERDVVVFGWNGTLFQRFMLGGVQLMVDAFCRAHERAGGEVAMRLEITGTGAYFEELGAWIAERHPGRPVEVRGWIDPSQMGAYLDGVDVGLYALRLPDAAAPGAAADATFLRAKSPTKLFEYMAKGIPVVSTAVGEAPRFLEPGRTGLVGDDVETLAGHMERLARDPGLRAAMGQAARTVCVERFSLDRAGRDVAEVLRRAARARV